MFTSLILLNIVKNTPSMRKVIGDELEVYLLSFELTSDGYLAGPMILSKVLSRPKYFGRHFLTLQM
jgi:hypothetical protein